MTFAHLKTKILLADDHMLVLDGIKSLLKDSPDFYVAATAANGKELLDLLKIHAAEIIITDIDMPEMGGLEAAGIIRDQYPQVKVIALTMHSEAGMIRKMSEAGVSGYILKNISKEELLHALQQVKSGKKYFSSEVGAALLNGDEKDHEQSNVVVMLTDREKEIIRMIADGLTNTEIGEKLFISPRTVDTHRTNLMRKLGVNNIAGLVKFALRNNLAE